MGKKNHESFLLYFSYIYNLVHQFIRCYLSKQNINILIVNGQLKFDTKKYHVFAPMGRFQLELIYLYFPPSSQLVYLCFCPVGFSLL